MRPARLIEGAQRKEPGTTAMYEEAIEGFRLSPQQGRVWRLQELKSAHSYAAQAAAIIEGALKPELLQQAIEQTINRHEILRTTFRLLAEMEIPLQVIGGCNLVWRAEARPLKGNLEELQDDIESLLEAERQPPFDAKSGGVFRASLFDLTKGHSLLLITVPAFCADLLALRNLLVEIGNEYEALVSGSQYEMEPMQYADISEWENELLAAEDSNPGREFWRRRRADAQAAARSFKLPYEKRDAATTSPRRMSSFQTTLPATVTNLIEETARTYDCSLPAILLASWQALLWKLSGAELIQTGTAFDGRQYAELETALGLLVRHLPISSHMKQSLSFAELAIQLDAEMNEARKWQEYFFVEDGAAPLDDAQQTRVGFESAAWPPAFAAAGISIRTLVLSSICES
ncbi:MAG TPA: condensation domain-containing protein, partial [Pyrinomonadaceae bacterium]